MKKLLAPLLVILFAVLMRLAPHPANAAPIAAMALFGGVYLDKKYALIIPLVALFVSDFFLGFHNTMLFVYGSFLLSGGIGLWLKNHKQAHLILAGTLISSVLFFIITNFGVWLMGGMYIKDLTGLLQCYTLALPFFRNTILGDLFYTGIFFGGFELAKIIYLSQSKKLTIPS